MDVELQRGKVVLKVLDLGHILLVSFQVMKLALEVEFLAGLGALEALDFMVMEKVIRVLEMVELLLQMVLLVVISWKIIIVKISPLVVLVEEDKAEDVWAAAAAVAILAVKVVI